MLFYLFYFIKIVILVFYLFYFIVYNCYFSIIFYFIMFYTEKKKPQKECNELEEKYIGC